MRCEAVKLKTVLNSIFRIALLVLFLLHAATSMAGKLNVRDADIRALVTQISDITGKSFVIDPRVKGNVTVVSNAEMTPESLYEVFLSVLNVHGFTAVESGDVIKIVPSTGAKQDSLRIDQSSNIAGEEMITRVVEVKNTPAVELVPILRPMIPQYGHLAGVASANALIITDHAENINRILTIIKRLDSAESEELEVVQLKEAWVSDVVALLGKLTKVEVLAGGKNKASAAISRVSVVADERTNRLIIKGEPSARARIKELVMRLDEPSKTQGSTQVIYLRHADSTKVAEILKSLIEPKQSQPSSQKTAPNVPSNIQSDEALNALVIMAEPGQMKQIREIVRQLDVRRVQVLIEAAIVEVIGDTNQAVGMQWGFGNEESAIGGVSFNNVGNSLNQIIAAVSGGVGTLADGGISLAGGGGSGDELEFGVLLQALAGTSNTNILSTPSIMTLDNEEAEIVVGQNVPFITGSSTNTGSGVSNPFTTVSRQDVGLTLRVTPHIHDGNVVRLEIYQESSALVTKSTVQTADVTTNKRSIKTTILADDGETIVLGGLVEDSLDESQNKVPLLGDIPILGRLFRSSVTTHNKRNLMVFLQPTIIRNVNNVSALTHRKYQGLKTLQRSLSDSGVSLDIDVDANFPVSLDDLFQNLDAETSVNSSNEQAVEAEENID